MKHATDRRVTGVTWRAIAIGAILCVPNVFWVLEVEGMWHSGHPTTISLFWNVVLNVFILILANLVVKRFRPEWAMTQGELITIYVMLSVASGLAGHDTLALTIPAIAHPFHFATAENQWRELFFRYIPRHLVVYDPEEVILQGFYEGDALDQFYTWRVFAPWLRLTLWWTSFILALGLVMVCINIFVRKQWTEHEKLAYPIIQLPMAITEGGGTSSFFRNRALWIGFGLVAALDILNGLHALFPHVPSFPVRHDQRTIRFTEAPWSAMGNLPVPLYPFVIGLGYLLPLDLSFSMWFFYLFARFQQVFSAASGLRLPGAPFLSEQSIGGWMAVFFAAVWATRGHLRAVIAHLFGGKQMDDSGEPIRYRTAAVIMVMSFAYIVYFCVHAGMTIPIILPFMAFFFALSVGITRVRAEFGPPAHEMAGMVNGQQFLINILGTRGFGFENLGVVPFFWFFSGRGYREHIMPHQLEGLKMAERARMNTKRLVLAIGIALVVGSLGSWWAGVSEMYRLGYARAQPFVGHIGQFGWAAGHFSNPQDPNVPASAAMAGGLVFTFMLMFMRMKFMWWPLHPAAYAIAMTNGVGYFWSCLVISTVIKFVVLRFGGMQANRKATSFFFGVILGEYCVGAFWSALSVILQTRTYDFAPG
ncbi:hypothetical protein HN371_12135 [Candidatus Poribacteria bacterium]|jgi:hypothetical protein|nr:hypothetical protein [Candidatus Poribacteria bacterium]MBT5535671.1 hypothetical protein [Candidatus Poribacteria bacterium]MBT7808797.1 hypothetical protein [Candidatus Poribacteria bacterium]